MIQEQIIVIPIIGKTNVGKSTLFNRLIKKNISITSKKKNTTQQKIIGIDTDTTNKKQYIYIDTPGFCTTLNFHKNIKKNIYSFKKYFNNIKINLIFLVLENHMDFYNINLIKKLEKLKIEILIFINKIDKIKNKLFLLPYIEKLIKNNKYIRTIIPTSNKEKLDIEKIKKHYIDKFLIKKNFFFKKQQKTNCSNNFIIKEKIREKIFRFTGDEIPYLLDISIIKIVYKKNIIKIFCRILTFKKQHIKIIIGKNGQKINKIIKLSQIDIKKFFHKEVKIHFYIKMFKD